ncbi:Mpo1-like protein [Klebsiella pneumoniae]|uniref:Mpo1-like protein n=1 Tax=Klebsiella pneumoniae TaxID=573 RepID=UPI001F4EE40E|nr:Mpo1-like protein [Klebsiella pneumoniae]MCH9373825.1 DUF962 domain-containing protein [Klebsiella pneumoniae]MCH9480950.1 DUF962 domain-containing protein [Klebsiella pneumoniae]
MGPSINVDNVNLQSYIDNVNIRIADPLFGLRYRPSPKTTGGKMTLRHVARSQWNGYRHTHLSRANVLIHLFTAPVFVLGTCAILFAVLTASPLWAVGGLLAAGAAMALQGFGHRLEVNAPAPFTGPGNAVLRILLEQWVTFPRYLLSGAWRQRK